MGWNILLVIILVFIHYSLLYQRYIWKFFTTIAQKLKKILKTELLQKEYHPIV